MIQTGPTLRILVATQPVDFRNGIDGLAATCRKQFEQDPMTGGAFIFRNRKGTAIKILLYDGQGYWLCQKKRLSTGEFSHWPQGRFGRPSPGGPPAVGAAKPAETPSQPGALPRGALSN